MGWVRVVVGTQQALGPQHCTPTLHCVCWQTCKAQLCCTAVLQSHCSTPATAQPQTTASTGTPNPSGSTSAPFHVLMHGVNCKLLKIRGWGGHGSLCRMAHGAASFQPAFSSSAQLCDAKEKICFPKMTQTHPRKPFQGTKWQRFRFLNARIQHAKKPKRHSKLRENLSCSLFSSPRPFIPKPQSDFFGWFRCPRKQRRAQGLQECSSWRVVLPWDGIWVLCARTPHPTHPL